ncbi:MAG: carbon-nitrogen hydrolase family protein [Deltaproteobacteria bacterium]|jgi:predicted amidohydrolase|nr:carbon-nitrogen hydrolase family protein [Deltaproteobacteria bacterium]
MKNHLVIATCQFPVSADIDKNAACIMKQMASARDHGADVAHFSESSLSGYAGIDFKRINKQHSVILQGALDKISDLASKLELWAIIGGHQFEGRQKKPYNCLWIIDSRGNVAHRYDKRFCTGKAGELEHFHYKPGRDAVQFKIRGIPCGVLTCHEWRYPELYREQFGLGTKVLFQSWYDGNLSKAEYQTQGREMGSLITGTVRGSAANNQLWISASNTSRKESCFASFVVRPDGRIVHQLKRNVAGVLITWINSREKFADPSGPWRQRARKGILHSGV